MNTDTSMLSRTWNSSASVNSSSTSVNVSGLENEETNRCPRGLINKPVRGWLHPDQKITESGICYAVRYIGCLEVNTSMKSLDFDTRSSVAKECINKLCEAAGLKTADKKRKVNKRLLRMLAEKPNMDHAGANVSLTITSSYLLLVALDNGQVIANHEMPNISFASGGDADMLDFVSYVAKDERYGRACFVLECGGGLAQDVLITIGQAFELRYKRFLKTTPTPNSDAEGGSAEASGHNGNVLCNNREDPDYYNDLPGKVPPDFATDSEVNTGQVNSNDSQNGVFSMSKVDINHNPQTTDSQLSSNVSDSLIDFVVDLPPVNTYRKAEPEYVNTTAVIFNERLTASLSSAKSKNDETDVFDMQPMSCSLMSEESSLMAVTLQPINSSNLSIAVEKVRTSLIAEPWFHGPISRKNSESLVIRDGDFLVRESQGSPGQYVLTGMQSGQRKHLLLIDPEGVIRTKDQVFESVGHLIRYHMDNSLPIVSAESALLLKTPICKIMPIGKSVQV